MPQLLTVSRAARLVGVSRGALQRKIYKNELTTFEGKLKASDLLRAYPEAKLEDDSALERVRAIKARAKPGDREKPSLPSPEVLASRLSSLSQTLVETQDQLQHYSLLMTELIKQLQSQNTPATQKLLTWLQKNLAQHPQPSPRKTALLVKDTFLRMISASVKLMPSGHEFFVEGQQSLLEAALNSGLNISYGCSSGHCGACKARVVSGDCLKVRDHDYILSPTEKNLGYILMCSYTAVTDMLIEAAEARHKEDIAIQNIQAQIKQITKPSPDFMILQVSTPKTQSLRFMAGQSVKLQLDKHKEQYTVASCPCDGQHLQFHIRQTQSEFCQQLFKHSQIGDHINLTGAYGEFTLTGDETQPLIFIAQNDGFIGLKSLIEQSVSIDRTESIHLYWIAKTPTGHYMNNLCRAWHDALDNFTYTPLISPSDHNDAKHILTNIDTDYKQLQRRQLYVAGDKTFVETIKQQLIDKKSLPTNQYYALNNPE